MKRRRGANLPIVIGSSVFAMVAAGCAGGSPGVVGHGPTPPPSAVGFQKISDNNTGTPQHGGTLNILSSTDTDYLDPNVTYYSFGYAIVRPFDRSLYSLPNLEGHQEDAVPDLATSMPDISSDGKTYRITLRSGVFWDTSPKRQVTAADVVRGVKTACNPAQPFGGLPDFDFLIVGYKKFCAGFAKVQPNASAIAKYTENTNLPGVSVDPSNPETVVFKLTQPASFFTSMLALPTFSPRAKEMDAYVPASAQAAQHTIADGPYKVQSYQPTKQITYVRNTAWNSSTDPIRKAYVDKITVNMTVSDRSVGLKQQQAGSPTADLCELCVDPASAVRLINSNDPGLTVQSEVSSNPYVLFNTASPNNNGALGKVEVRQALSYALNRSHLLQVAGGAKLNVPLTHVLPSQIHGSQNFDLYPNDPTKAKQLLQQAGASNLTLKFLYRPSSATSKKMFQVIQQDLAGVGVKVTGVPAQDADFYTKYLQKPQSARAGQWDLSLAGWGPDWYGDAALSFFRPLFDGRTLPPASSDFGLFNDPTVNSCIDAATTAKTTAEANTKWQECDKDVMKAAAFFPITNPNEPLYHAPFVHNTVFSPMMQDYDWSNIWLDKNKNGG